MSKDAKNFLAPPDASDKNKSSKRKMTQAILEDQEKEKEGIIRIFFLGESTSSALKNNDTMCPCCRCIEFFTIVFG